MSVKVEKAFVLAAGLGARMLHLTKTCPKPLLEVAGRSMLDRALDSLAAAGVKDVVVNTCYLAEMVERHLQKRTDIKITISREDELLETAGGVCKVINYFGDKPFFVLNSDVVLVDGNHNTLLEMAEAWDDTKMDLMLLLHPVETAHFFEGEGDYYLQGECAPIVFCKHLQGDLNPNTVFAGPRIVHPRLFEGVAEGARSFLELFHKAEKAGRLYGFLHKGNWYHVGTPEALDETNKILGQEK